MPLESERAVQMISMMRSILPTLVLLLLGLLGAGCAEQSLARAMGNEAPPEYEADDPLGGDEADYGSGDDDDDDDGVEAPDIYNLDPAPDSVTHHYRRPLSVVFTEEASGTSVTITGPTGAPVPTEMSWSDDGSRVWIHPQPRLEPNTEYGVFIGSGGQPLGYRFTTSPIGLLDEGVELGGRVYALDLDGLELAIPSGLGSNTDLAAAGSPLLQIGDAADGQATLSIGLGFEDDGNWNQDACAEAGPVSADEDITLTEALLTGEPDVLTFPLGGALVQLEEATVAFDVLPAGDGISELALDGWLRLDSLDALFGTDAGCELVSALEGTGCEPCPSGDSQCVYVSLGGVSGLEVDAELTPVTSAELDACPQGPTAFLGCSAAGAGSGSLVALLLASVAVGFRRRRTSGILERP